MTWAMSRRHISKELKTIVLRLSEVHGLSTQDVSRLTEVSDRTVRRIRKLYRDTGDVARTPLCAGRPRALDGLDTMVSEHNFS